MHLKIPRCKSVLLVSLVLRSWCTCYQADRRAHLFVLSSDAALIVALNVPLGFQTDVNAAALGEMSYGNHGAVKSCAYVTVGTGIGAGIVVNGEAITGILHPEAGHIK